MQPLYNGFTKIVLETTILRRFSVILRQFCKNRLKRFLLFLVFAFSLYSLTLSVFSLSLLLFDSHLGFRSRNYTCWCSHLPTKPSVCLPNNKNNSSTITHPTLSECTVQHAPKQSIFSRSQRSSSRTAI